MKYQIDKQFKNRVVKLPFSAAMLRLSHVFMPLMLWFVGAPGVRAACQKRGGLWEYTFTPSDCGADAPCVMFFHGGGFGYSAAPHHKHMAAKLAATTGCRVIMLEYRLLPEHPYPAAREDAAAAYRRMCEDYPAAQGYAVIGDSAGGALAVYAAFDAQRQGLPAPKIELLLYPRFGGNPRNGIHAALYRYAHVECEKQRENVANVPRRNSAGGRRARRAAAAGAAAAGLHRACGN